MTSSPDTTEIKPEREKRLPVLFAREKHLLGWQGLTVSLPQNWNLAQFGGTHAKGQLRVDDEDGPRLEISWQHSSTRIDIAKSVARFMQTLERNAKKSKTRFVAEPKARVVSRSRKRKDQVTNFGWNGERDEPLGQGWGVSWQCPDCGRVVVGHVIGRGSEKPERVRELAATVLESLECHGQGGWQTWSVFDLHLEMPQEFALERAKLVTGKLELNWIRPHETGLLGWTKRDETISLTRFALASQVLHDETLTEWTNRVVKPADKKRAYDKPETTQILGHDAVCARGRIKDPRRRAFHFVLDRVFRQPRFHTDLRAWHCEPINKLFALRSDISPKNAHVIEDILDSIQ